MYRRHFAGFKQTCILHSTDEKLVVEQVRVALAENEQADQPAAWAGSSEDDPTYKCDFGVAVLWLNCSCVYVILART